MQHCARNDGIICSPLAFFSLLGRSPTRVRLSFSSVSRDEIRRGIFRFWKFAHEQGAGDKYERRMYPRPWQAGSLTCPHAVPATAQ